MAGATIQTAGAADASNRSTPPEWVAGSIVKLKQELVARYGESQRGRIERGLSQVAGFWLEEDGNAAVFEQFVLEHFAGDPATLDAVFQRYQFLLEQLDGHMLEIIRAFRTQADLDLGPMLPLDGIFAGYDPSSHVSDDLFENKLAFVVLLNFPLTTLDERLQEGTTWTRRQWAEARLAGRFGRRVPASVNLEMARATSRAEQYISEYNIWMHHLVDGDGRRLFPPGLRLLSHWNLRDQIKADYVDGEDALARQRTIAKVMERIVTQTIPGVVIDNPHVDWNPFTNEVSPSTVKDSELPLPPDLTVTNAPEPDTRYAVLKETFLAAKKVDPYSPTAPTLIKRRFDEDREIPEERVRQMLIDVVSSPLVAEVGKLIQTRLGRPLEPFDIWYNGFRPRSKYTESELDEIVSSRYPNAEAFKNDIPNILTGFGWSEDRARYIAGFIEVDPARGSGHAMGASMRSASARLRTRVEKSGMNYKGYNIAIHELGHNVEQVLSLHDVDYYTLQGVPNTAFTEALAFVFQARDLERLGLTDSDPQAEALKTLNDFWGTYEIAGVALVDMAVWHWMYDHPDASPAELKEAVLGIARDVWNQYYAPVFGVKDVVLLAIYSHMIDGLLYLPDYPIGHLIAHQIEEQIKSAPSVATEFELMVRAGRIAPDLWMKNATGSPVSADALLQATERALAIVNR